MICIRQKTKIPIYSKMNLYVQGLALNCIITLLYVSATPSDNFLECRPQTWTDTLNLWIKSKPKVMDWPENVHYCRNITKQPILKQEPQTFQRVEDRLVYVFSAYFEKRQLVDGPCIRIIAGGFQEQFNHIGDMYCQLWYHDRATPAVSRAKYEVIYRSTGHADMWTAHFILCKLPPGVSEPPYAVSVTPQPCSTPRTNLLVLNREEPKPTPTFGVCLSAIYGRYRDWVGVAEMFEMYALLGANEIVIYNLSLSRETDITMKHYLKDSTKNLTAVQWQLPREMDKTSTFFQRGVLNDCLYRLSHRHRYVAMQDLDEVIVPRSAKTWSELFRTMYHPNGAIYMFQHSYFRRNTTDEVPYTITQSSYWTTKDVLPAGKIRCKSMYNALLTKSVDVHYHYELVKGTEEYMVPPELAKLHHYRISPMESFRKNPNIEFIEDRYIEYYKPDLMTKLRKAIADIESDIKSSKK